MQSIHNIAEICAQLGVEHAVMSPGSRCAPLTISFVQHTKIKQITVADERSAGFIALGIAQASDTPVVLICTSGSALLNYAPAVAEAFYQQVPLIVLSADRPTEWVDQLDGQTIHQPEAFGNHVKKSFQLPVDHEHSDSKWYLYRIISEAVNLSTQEPKGPIQVNIPLREPLYPSQPILFDSKIKVIQNLNGQLRCDKQQILELNNEIKKFSKVLAIAGQGNYTEKLSQSLSKLNVPVVKEVISNLPYNKNQITTIDLIMGEEEVESPDLVISFGLSVLSKPIKKWLRKSGCEHWHIQPYSGNAPDTYQKLTKVIFSSYEIFNKLKINENKAWTIKWRDAELSFKEKLNRHFDTAKFSEFKALKLITDSLPTKSIVHYANSMTVRYANYYPGKDVKVYSNRGTSGIDGSSSTAVGTSLIYKNTNTLITGDLAFFYDSNAYWNSYIKSNLRIVVLNNNGGGIFRMIDGPTKQQELEPYFVIKQPLEAKKIAELFQFEYIKCHKEKELDIALETFFNNSQKPKLLEIITNGLENTTLLKQFKKEMKL